MNEWARLGRYGGIVDRGQLSRLTVLDVLRNDAQRLHRAANANPDQTRERGQRQQRRDQRAKGDVTAQFLTSLAVLADLHLQTAIDIGQCIDAPQALVTIIVVNETIAESVEEIRHRRLGGALRAQGQAVARQHPHLEGQLLLVFVAEDGEVLWDVARLFLIEATAVGLLLVELVTQQVQQHPRGLDQLRIDQLVDFVAGLGVHHERDQRPYHHRHRQQDQQQAVAQRRGHVSLLSIT